ncbi:MAG: heme peroxidase family protein [Bacteroidota bacterium]
MNVQRPGKHGAIRGLDSARSSDAFEGRFGRMFRTLPKASFPADALDLLAAKMTSPDEGDPTPETEKDDEENSGISAGYTYLGQFIDHDLTFDPASSLQTLNDPDALVDYRTPRFDLDNLYGRGPDDQPYLYESDGKKFILGRSLTGSDFDNKVRDLPRNNPSSGDKRAIIGDPRNDENVIVSQLQSIFLRFHNRMIDVLNGADFESVQRMVRWHYQWVVLTDFLPTIIGKDTWKQILPSMAKKTDFIKDPPQLKFYHWHNEPFMPVEFSVAAYRFGHSMVRPIYRLNQTIPRFPIFSFDNPAASLTGFREFPSNWAIDWRLFFDFGNNPNPLSPQRIQPAYKPDSSLVNPLGNLPPTVAVNPNILALRNLLRGNSMRLPSGQDVARKMGIAVIPDEKLKVGKANEDGAKSNPPIASLHPAFRNKAPLWFYILSESQQAFINNDTPLHLGPVGGRIVGEVFVGLMLGDKHSFLNQDPLWQPLDSFKKNGKFGIAELISQAIQQ